LIVIFVKEKLLSKDLIIELVSSSEQLAHFLAKFLRGPRIRYISFKLGAYYWAWGKVLKC